MENTASKQELLKTAATQLRSLSKEVSELREKQAQQERAREIIAKMVQKGNISETEVLEKLSKLEQQSVEDLKVTEKALEMSKNANFNLGSLGDKTSVGEESGLDPLTNYLINGED